MVARHDIADLARDVGGGLEAYIQVHNRVFEEAATARSFVKNLFGRGVPMPVLLADAEGLVPMWTAIRQRVEACRISVDGAQMEGERRYLEILAEYVQGVQHTVSALVERQALLAEGSRTR